MREFAYLARCEKTGHYKIGSTARPVQRMLALQEQSPTPLKMLHVFDNFTKNPGFRTTEYELHNRFAEKMVSPEWFALSDEDVRAIMAIPAKHRDREPAWFSGRGILCKMSPELYGEFMQLIEEIEPKASPSEVLVTLVRQWVDANKRK